MRRLLLLWLLRRWFPRTSSTHPTKFVDEHEELDGCDNGEADVETQCAADIAE